VASNISDDDDCDSDFVKPCTKNKKRKTCISKATVLSDDSEPDDSKVTSKPAKPTVFSCNVCNYSSKLKWNLKLHLKKHAKLPRVVGTLRCPIGNCEITFKTLSDVEKHIFIAHKIPVEVDEFV